MIAAFVWLARTVRPAGAVVQPMTVVGLWLCLSLWFYGAQLFIPNLFTGMDTTWAVAYLAGWYAMWIQRRSPAAVGLAGGLAFFVRPDFVLLTLGVPLVAAGLEKERRRYERAVLGYCLVGIAGCLVAAHFLLGSSLPLPFYAKVASVYREFDRAAYNEDVFKKFAFFVAVALLPGLACLAAHWALRGRRPSFPPSIAAGLIMAGVFILYITFGVMQIMGHYGRFYWPVLPFLFAWFAWITSDASLPLYRSRWLVPGALAILASGVFLDARSAVRRQRVMNVSALENYRQERMHTWPGLMGLQPGSVLATTEVGHPGSLLPNVTIIDLAGLNDKDFATNPNAVDEMFRERPPDVMYMPHTHYRGLLRQIEAHPVFRSEYDIYDPQDINVPLPVAVRRDSQYARVFLAQLHKDFAAIKSPRYKRGWINHRRGWGFRETNE